MAADSKQEQPTAKRSRVPSATLLILAGAVLVIVRLVLPYKTGLIFKGSIEAVNSICRSGAGSQHPSLQSCNEAAAWMAGLNIAALAGFVLAWFGVYLAWRARRPGAGPQ